MLSTWSTSVIFGFQYTLHNRVDSKLWALSPDCSPRLHQAALGYPEAISQLTSSLGAITKHTSEQGVKSVYCIRDVQDGYVPHYFPQ